MQMILASLKTTGVVVYDLSKVEAILSYTVKSRPVRLCLRNQNKNSGVNLSFHGFGLQFERKFGIIAIHLFMSNLLIYVMYLNDYCNQVKHITVNNLNITCLFRKFYLITVRLSKIN